MREFDFELQVCGLLEEREEGVVARQLGTSVEGHGNRIVDVVVVRPGPAFEARTRLPGGEIPIDAVESEAGIGGWTPVTDAIRGSPQHARRVAERAADVGYFELERRSGRPVVRRVAQYPDWFGTLVGIENKPDLGTPGDLEFQLKHDVALGLLDEVWLATASYVTGAHLNRIPPEVGVVRVTGLAGSTDGEGNGLAGSADSEGNGLTGSTDGEGNGLAGSADGEGNGLAGSTDGEVDSSTADADEPFEVVREATPLETAGPGVEVLAEHPMRTDVAVVDGAAKARARTRLAERAYGKGWRTFDFPACAEGGLASVGSADALPYCAWKDRLVDAASECGPACPGFAPAAAPEFDLDAERARETAWNREAATKSRTQSRLDDWRE